MLTLEEGLCREERSREDSNGEHTLHESYMNNFRTTSSIDRHSRRIYIISSIQLSWKITICLPSYTYKFAKRGEEIASTRKINLNR